MVGAARRALFCFAAELAHKVAVRMDLVALYSGIAFTFLKEKTEGKVFVVAVTQLKGCLGLSFRVKDELERNLDLSTAIIGVNDTQSELWA